MAWRLAITTVVVLQTRVLVSRLVFQSLGLEHLSFGLGFLVVFLAIKLLSVNED